MNCHASLIPALPSLQPLQIEILAFASPTQSTDSPARSLLERLPLTVPPPQRPEGAPEINPVGGALVVDNAEYHGGMIGLAI